jgi:hypothetical protein
MTPVFLGLIYRLLHFQKTQEEWRVVFYVVAAFDLFGAIVFAIFCRGELEPWSRDPDEEDIVKSSTLAFMS